MPYVGMGLVGAREWAQWALVVVALAGSSRTNTCASALAEVVVGLGPYVSGRLVDDHRSASMSGGGWGLGSAAAAAADGVYVSSYERASWCVSVFENGS